VSARYLAALLCEHAGPGTEGAIVSAVAVQQRDFGEPLDDVIVDFKRHDGQVGRLSLQAKRSLTISSAATNDDFREIVHDSLKTLNKSNFREDIDRFGSATGSIAAGPFRVVTTLCELARASDTPEHFEARFAKGSANAEHRAVRNDIAALLSEQLGSACSPALLHRFLKHFIIVQFDYLHAGAIDSAEAIDLVRPALADSDNTQAPNLWSALYRVAREGAGRSQQFSRASLVNLLSRTFRLRGAPSLRDSLSKLMDLARTWVRDIDDDVRGTRLARSELALKLEPAGNRGNR
jgi:hypothetical protein